MASLYEETTWRRTPRLQALAQGNGSPTAEEIAELWEVFKTGQDELGIPGTLAEFADWLTARNGWDFAQPCEVSW